jgi:hypothetical protein
MPGVGKKKPAARRLGFNAAELDLLRSTFIVEPGSADDEAFIECLRMALSGGAWCTAEVSRYRMLEFLRNHVEPFAFDELIRFTQCERDPIVPLVTGIVDITTTEVRYKQNSDRGLPLFSVHKGVTYKYQATVTPMYTPISVSRALQGRRHDVFLLQPCTETHYKNDVILADGGYAGTNPDHFIIPIRKPHRGDLSPEQKRWNKSFGRIRSRIERSFGNLKNQFRMLKWTSLDAAAHELFVKFIFAVIHVLVGCRRRRLCASSQPRTARWTR